MAYFCHHFNILLKKILENFPQNVFHGQRLNVHVLIEKQGFGSTDLSCIENVCAANFGDRCV